MEIRYALNAENFTDYNLYLTDTPEYRLRVRNQGLWAGLMVLAVGAVMMIVTKCNDWIATAAASAGGAVLIALLFPAIARSGSKMAVLNAIKTEGETMFREQTLSVDEHAIHVEANEGENCVARDFQREDVTAVDTYKSILLIHFSNGNLLIVPRAALNEETEKTLFMLKA